MLPTELIVSKAITNDAQILAKFNIAMARETEDLKLDLPTVLAGVHGVLEDTAHGFYLVARLAGEVVGALLITYEWSDWRNGRLWWIQSVYVLPQWRSQGVFRALYQHVNELAQQTPDTRGIRLYVEKDNHTAQAVYQNLGMSQTAYRIFETTF